MLYLGHMTTDTALITVLVGLVWVETTIILWQGRQRPQPPVVRVERTHLRIVPSLPPLPPLPPVYDWETDAEYATARSTRTQPIS
jgi:hypothetical protein